MSKTLHISILVEKKNTDTPKNEILVITASSKIATHNAIFALLLFHCFSM